MSSGIKIIFTLVFPGAQSCLSFPNDVEVLKGLLVLNEVICVIGFI